MILSKKTQYQIDQHLATDHGEKFGMHQSAVASASVGRLANDRLLRGSQALNVGQTIES